MSNLLDNKLREDLERLKKIRAHRYVTLQKIDIKISEKIVNWIDTILCWILIIKLISLQGSSTLLGCSCPWTTYQDHWSSWTNCWSVQEKVKAIYNFSFGDIFYTSKVYLNLCICLQKSICNAWFNKRRMYEIYYVTFHNPLLSGNLIDCVIFSV